MKLLCTNRIVPSESAGLMSPTGETEYDSCLTVGQTYTVYGIWIEDNSLSFLVHAFEDLDYPVLMPTACFDPPIGCVPPMFVLSIKPQRQIFSSMLFRKDTETYQNYLEENGSTETIAEWAYFKRAVDAYNEYIDLKDKGHCLIQEHGC